MMLRGRLYRIVENDILQDILRLMTGTVGGRLIALVAMPFITRLYSPQDFALLAVYMAIVSMIGVIACLRFEVAIPLAVEEKDAVHLLVLALLIALSMAAVSLFAVLLAADSIAGLLGQPALAAWLWLVPLGILLYGSYAALQLWATRARRFGSIAWTRISQATAGVGTMLLMGGVGMAPLGLLLGSLINSSAGSLRLGIEAFSRDRVILQQVKWSGLAVVFREYYRFPLYSTPEALANLAGTQVPIMIVAAFAGSEAGFLFLAMQIMTAPMALLGSSISQVYVSRAPRALSEGHLSSLTLSILRRLIQIGFGPLIVAGALASIMLPIIFGLTWTRSGEIIILMIPWIMLQFIVSPISMALHVTGRQSTAAILQIGGMILRISMTLAAPMFIPNGYVIGAVGGAALFYAVYLYVVLEVSGVFQHRGWLGQIKGPLIRTLPWMVLGIAIIIL